MSLVAPLSERISHESAARISHETAARISHDAAARISHDKTAGAAPAVASAFSLNEFIAKFQAPLPRKALRWAKGIGVSGLVLSGMQQGATAAAPHVMNQLYYPVAEVLGYHTTRAAATNEPAEAAPMQGNLTKREKYHYEFRITKLDTAGSIYGRFRGDGWPPDAPKDPRWWEISGNSDGSRAELNYTNEDGKILGHISLTRSKDGATWDGHLVGIDESIAEKDMVDSPIVIASSSYALTGLRDDPYLNTPSVLRAAYDR